MMKMKITYYSVNVQLNISQFISEDSEKLNSFISDLDIIYFSEDSLKNLFNSYEKAFISFFIKIMSDIRQNEEKVKDYFINSYIILNY